MRIRPVSVTITVAAAIVMSAHCNSGAHRVAGVTLVCNGIRLTGYAGSKNSVSATTVPCGVITALMPVVPATTTLRPCSMARILANANC